MLFAGIDGAFLISSDLKPVVGTSDSAEEGVNGMKGEKVVVLGPSDD